MVPERRSQRPQGLPTPSPPLLGERANFFAPRFQRRPSTRRPTDGKTMIPGTSPRARIPPSTDWGILSGAESDGMIESTSKTKEARMRVFAFIVLGATILALAPAATAQRHDPRFQFCMERGRSGRSSTVECRFNTMHQCRMTASGLRARCFENPFWRGSR